MRTHRRAKNSDRSNVLMFDNGGGLTLRSGLRECASSPLIDTESLASIGEMTYSISHDLRNSLTAIYANAEFLERDDVSASVRAELLKDRKSTRLNSSHITISYAVF